MQYTDGTKETTIGPWLIGSERGDVDASEYRENDTTGYPYFIHRPRRGVGDPGYHLAIGIQDLEDARMMAAAKSMYSALDNLICAAETGYGVTQAIREARAAIAKARGEN